MKTRPLTALLISLLTLCTSAGAMTEPDQKESGKSRPNVILFLADDQSYGDMSLHGNPHVNTVRMDTFAKQSIELTHFYVSPVCSPTRASLMTGRYHLRTGVTDVRHNFCKMNPGEVTIAEALKGAGYKTAIFGKWHLGDTRPHRPMDQGFDESIVHTGSGIYGKNSYFNPMLLHNGQSKSFQGYCLDIFTDHAIGFLHARKTDGNPFFLYLPSNLVHTPLQSKKVLAQPFIDKGLDDKTSQIYGMLKCVDNNFGRLLDKVEEFGFDDNTIIIYTSDNGPCHGGTTPQRYMAGLHGLKGTVYENGIRVPCFIRWPAGQIQGGSTSSQTTAHIDIMPTVLAACQVKKPKELQLDGVNLLPLLKDPQHKLADRMLFSKWDGHGKPQEELAFAVRFRNFKLVQANGMNRGDICNKYSELCRAQEKGEKTLTDKPTYELFDIEKDPGELHDISAQHPEMVESMMKKYKLWFKEVSKDL